MTRLYFNTHETHWLYAKRLERLLGGYTLFVAIPRLERRKTPFPPALHPYCVDSGGFSELQKHGRWRRSAAEYVALVRRIVGQLGPELCQWVAPQDCMCEDLVIYGGIGPRGAVFKGTREMRGMHPGDREQDRTIAIRIHQRLTVNNYVELITLAPEIKFIPVLQGQTLEDYEYCDQLYRKAGVNLATAPVVGLGSVCRRQAEGEIEEIVDHFHAKGYRLHGFGVKTLGLGRYGPKLVSADSLAWSEDARRRPGGFGPVHPAGTSTHKNCANCPDYAVWWHRRLVNKYPGVVMA
ncbi:deazapurine DNA modification protein DpdA family protein [Streptomyces sp. NPDC001705]